jgi:cell division transport system permease protein
MRIRFVLSEMLIGLRRNLTLTFAVVVNVAIALALFGTGWLVRDQVNATKGYWYGKIEVNVFLCLKTSTSPTCSGGAVTQLERSTIQQKIQALPVVEHVYYESQQQAYERFKQLWRNSPDLVKNVTPDALPESFRVKLKNPKEYAAVASAVGNMPGVDQVQDQRKLLQRLFDVFHGFQDFAWAVSFLALLAAVFLIGNSVRVAAFSRRRETGIMRLVGATNFYIQLPFLLEGVVAALGGVALAYAGVYLIYKVLFDSLLRHNVPAINWIGSGPVHSLLWLLPAIGVSLSALASFVTLRRYLRV